MPTPVPRKARLTLEDGSVFWGEAYGYRGDVAGEAVFTTGMVGYEQSLTDPSYRGQILVFTYPLIGNYGVTSRRLWESARPQVSGVVVSGLNGGRHLPTGRRDLGRWLRQHRVPVLAGVDTRALTLRLRERGVMLGRLGTGGSRPRRSDDPNRRNLVAEVSCARPRWYGRGRRRVALIDCGCKESIIRSLVERGVAVHRLPWNTQFDASSYHGVVVSNGPGDPTRCGETIGQLKGTLRAGVPTFGICLGAQLMALAVGGRTYKLKYGHRSQNQPVTERGTGRSFVTSQNHGYAIVPATLPSDWRVWFTNVNDGTVEGIRHRRQPWSAVQFHPEAQPGPNDAAYLFDRFVAQL